MSGYSNNMKPNAHPATVGSNVEGDSDPVAKRYVNIVEGNLRGGPVRWALFRWLRDTRSSLALSFLPLIVLLITAWFPLVVQSAALRALPLVALVLYLPLLIWDIARLVTGRPPRDPFARRRLRRWPEERYLGRFVVRLTVSLVCLPALTVLALRAPFSGLPMVVLTVLPMLVYAIIVGVGGFFNGYLTITCGI